MTCFALLKDIIVLILVQKYAAVLTGDVLDESPAMRSLSIFTWLNMQNIILAPLLSMYDVGRV